MPTDARKPRQKRKARTVILAAVILLAAMGSVTLYLLGRPLPEETAAPAGMTAAAPPLAWGTVPKDGWMPSSTESGRNGRTVSKRGWRYSSIESAGSSAEVLRAWEKGWG